MKIIRSQGNQTHAQHPIVYQVTNDDVLLDVVLKIVIKLHPVEPIIKAEQQSDDHERNGKFEGRTDRCQGFQEIT